MTRRIGWGVLWLAGPGLVMALPTAAADTLESVEMQLLEKWGKVKSYSAGLTVTAELETNAGSSRTNGSGTLVLAVKDGQRRFRSKLTNVTLSDTFSSDELRTDTSLTTVCDGRHVYVLVEQTSMGMAFRTAAKERMDKPPTMHAPPILDPVHLFKTLRAGNGLKLVEASPADLPPVYTVEVIPKDPDDSIAKLLVYFARDSGIVLRTAANGRHVAWTMTATYSDVKVNVDMDPGSFVFKLPQGVGLLDATGR